MKEELSKLLTSFDDYGVYSPQKQLQRNKQRFSFEIQSVIYTDKETDQKFGFQKLNIDFLQSIFLKDDPKFKEIKGLMHQYNSQVQYYNGKSAKGLHFKPVVMDSMLKFMRLMLLAPDYPTKKRILDVSHQWFMRKLKPKQQKRSRAALEQQIKKIALEQKLLPESEIEKELPSDLLQQVLKHYAQNQRTIYPQIDTPIIELQNYNTRKVGIIDQHLHDRQSKGVNKDKERWLQRVKFRRPYLEQFHHQPSQKEEKEIHFTQVEYQPKESKQNLVKEQGISQEGQQLSKGEVIPTENKLHVQNQNPANDFGAPDEGDEQQQEGPYEQQQKSRGKLDPLVKVFMLQRLEKQRKEQVQAKNRLLVNRNKYNSTYSDGIQYISQVEDWARRRARLKTDVSKKIQARQGIRRLLGTSHDDKRAHSVEATMNQLKLNTAISQAKKITGQLNRERLNTEPSLSIFDRKRAKTEQSTSNQFSTMLSIHSRTKTRDSFLDQIQDIKIKFAKQKLYAPMSKLVGSLMHDAEKDEHKKTHRLELPAPMLLNNPFFKVGKKKKKKKKKK